VTRPAPAVALAVLACSASLAARAAEQAPPGAGDILQQMKPNVPPPPQSPVTGLSIRREDGASLPPGEAFAVTSLQIVGNTRFSTAELHALVAASEGKRLNLAELTGVAAIITDYYRNHGFPLARAIIPAQTVEGGRVTLQVLEANYGKITLVNRSRVSNSLLAATLEPLAAGAIIERGALDRTLLLESDVPDVAVAAVLKPGAAVGTSDLDVTVTDGPRGSGNVSVDDDGNKYTGRARLGATVNLFDPLDHGDVLTLSGLTSGSDLNFGRLAYEVTANGLGTRFGAAYSSLHYELGHGLEALDGHGTAGVGSGWIKQPLVRSQGFDLSLEAHFDRLTLRDALDAGGIRTNRHLAIWTGSVIGDLRDGLLAGAVNTWNLSFITGRLDFDDAAAQAADAATARTDGQFSKWNLNLARLQKFSAATGLYLSFAGQWTGDNLDASQKMIAGGPYSVRAYDLGVLAGDNGALGTAELQHDLGAAAGGIWQATAFVDVEHITVNKDPWAAGPNTATLSGAGLGLNWGSPGAWTAHAALATRLGGMPRLVPDSSTVHFWIELSRAF